MWNDVFAHVPGRRDSQCGRWTIPLLAGLLLFEATAAGRGPAVFRPATPLVLAAWERALAGHPDQRFSRYILAGIAKGFHIGADRSIELRKHEKCPICNGSIQC